MTLTSMDGKKDIIDSFFKLKSHFKSGSTFFEKPAVGDINGDGVLDLLYGGSKIVAINGINGQVIWEMPYELSSIDGSKTMFLEKYKYNALIVGTGKKVKNINLCKELENSLDTSVNVVGNFPDQKVNY